MTQEEIDNYCKKVEEQKRKDEREPMMNERPEPVYNYLNGLWRNLDEYKPRSYGKYPKSPEIYIMENATMDMYLAWYDTRFDDVFNRQTKKWVGEKNFGKYSWCYKHELFPLQYFDQDE